MNKEFKKENVELLLNDQHRYLNYIMSNKQKFISSNKCYVSIEKNIDGDDYSVVPFEKWYLDNPFRTGVVETITLI